VTGLSHHIKALAHIHHAYFLGLQLMISCNKTPEVMGDWMFRLFRKQHLDKFLSSFSKLGLTGLPDAVACAQYHCMANSVGGVPVEYMYENDQKAWVRFRYPRWMYHGPTLCGVPVEVSMGSLSGWYAHNGVSLKNPRLGYVCVSEDMTGEFGFCGYFKEYDYELNDSERLQFAKGELPPPYNPDQQPTLPSSEWSQQRKEKANRNYAMEFIRNAIPELAKIIGSEETLELCGRAARLIGLQYLQDTLEMVGENDGDANAAAKYLSAMFTGLGDDVKIEESADGRSASVKQTGLRIVRGLEGEDRELVLTCWQQLWFGALSSYRVIKHADSVIEGNEITWKIRDQIQ
jgi:hypothetical protein